MTDLKKYWRYGLALLWATAAVAAMPYQDGIYRDKAPGYNDEVIVTVTVRDGRIDSLKAENKNGEKSEYFQKAEEGLSKAIVEKQGIDGVDAVAGATGTSESILTAMKGILQQVTYTGDEEGRLLPNASPAGNPAASPMGTTTETGTPTAKPTDTGTATP